MIQTLIIDNYHPVSSNVLLSTHPMRRSRIKRAEAQIIGGEALRQGITKATAKRRVAIRCEGWPKGRPPDPSNLDKVFLDVLVACGLIVDDSSTWCQQDATVVVRAERYRTVVTLEDVP